MNPEELEPTGAVGSRRWKEIVLPSATIAVAVDLVVIRSRVTAPVCDMRRMSDTRGGRGSVFSAREDRHRVRSTVVVRTLVKS